MLISFLKKYSLFYYASVSGALAALLAGILIQFLLNQEGNIIKVSLVSGGILSCFLCLSNFIVSNCSDNFKKIGFDIVKIIICSLILGSLLLLFSEFFYSMCNYSVISRVLCWVIYSIGISQIFSSFSGASRKNCCIGGLTGGLTGGIAYEVFQIYSPVTGKCIGLALLGLFISLFLFFICQNLKKVYLIGKNNKLKEEIVFLDKIISSGKCRIGSDPFKSDLCIDGLSQFHAEIIKINNNILLKPVNNNTCFINGKRTGANGQFLRKNDVLRFGNKEYVFNLK